MRKNIQIYTPFRTFTENTHISKGKRAFLKLARFLQFPKEKRPKKDASKVGICKTDHRHSEHRRSIFWSLAGGSF